MRSVQGKRMTGLLFLILLLLIPCNAYAGTENGQSQGTEAYLEELYGLTDFSGADQVLEGEGAVFYRDCEAAFKRRFLPGDGKTSVRGSEKADFWRDGTEPEAVSGGGDVGGTLLGH